MSEVAGFRAIAPSVRGDAHVALASDGTGVVTRSGRVARWIGRVRTTENRAVAHRFAESLRQRYGSELAEQVLGSTGVDSALRRGRPLRVRHVRQAVARADALVHGVRERNVALARSYSRPVAATTDQSLLRIKIDDVARRSFAANSTVGKLVDPAVMAARVEAAIAEAGRDGAHFVTTEEAARIVSNVVHASLRNAYQDARDAALAKLSLDDSGSVSCRALEAAASRRDPPLSIAPGRLTRDAHEQLASRFQEAISDAAVPAERLQDDASLAMLADTVMDGFVAERATARKAVDALPFVNAVDKAALGELVLHDGVQAELVPAMGRAHVEVADRVAVLGDASDGDPAATIAAIRDRMTQAFASAGVEVNVENQAPLHRQFLRFLLAPHGRTAATAVAMGMNRVDSPLRAIGEGAAWYREVFPATDEAQRTVSSRVTGEERPVYAAESFREATRHAVIMDALAEVASEHVAEEDAVRLVPNSQLPDRAIADLRNLGVTMPAPDRLGAANDGVRISALALAAVAREVEQHVESKADAPLRDGMLEQSTVDFERASYHVAERELPADREAVGAALRDVCRDADGRLNARLLKGVSLVAYQAGLGCVYSVCLNPDRPDLALFNATPAVDARSVYSISRDAGGDALVTCRQSGPVTRLIRVNAHGMAEPVAVDRGTSRLDLTAIFRVDASTGRPAVEDVRIGYALAPLRDAGDGNDEGGDA